MPQVPEHRGAALARGAPSRLLPVEYYHVVFTLPVPISAHEFMRRFPLHVLPTRRQITGPP